MRCCLVRLLVAFLGGLVLPAPTSRGADTLYTAMRSLAHAVERHDAPTIQRRSFDIAQKVDVKRLMKLFETDPDFSHWLGDDGLRALSLKATARNREEAEFFRLAGFAVPAVAETLRHYGSGFPPATADVWQQYAEDLHNCGLRFADAFHEGDIGAVRSAAQAVQQSCSRCHDSFRAWARTYPQHRAALNARAPTPQLTRVDPKTRDEIRDLGSAFQTEDRLQLSKRAIALSAKVSLHEVMQLFGERRRGGLGVGLVPDNSHPDGIEAKLAFLSTRKLTAEDLRKERGPVLMLARDITALADVTIQHGLKGAFQTREEDRWLALGKQLEKDALELETAVKNGDPTEIRIVAQLITQNCTNCHSRLGVTARPL
jgi:cytochrome c556